MRIKNFFLVFLLSLYIIISVFSCCPKAIKLFDVDKRTITMDDSLIFTWDACGKPKLLFHEKPATDSAGIMPIDSSVRILEFTLAAKREQSQTIQVVMLPKVISDFITFQSTRNGDTIIARGEKNKKRWGNLFEILTVKSDSGVSLNVKHEGIMAELDAKGTTSMAYKGTPVEGYWELRHILTASEKLNLIPWESLQIHTTIQYKKR